MGKKLAVQSFLVLLSRLREHIKQRTMCQNTIKMIFTVKDSNIRKLFDRKEYFEERSIQVNELCSDFQKMSDRKRNQKAKKENS